MHLLKKLETEAGYLISDSEMVAIAEFLGVNISDIATERRFSVLKDELDDQNRFLTKDIYSKNIKKKKLYIRSGYVQEVVRLMKKNASATQNKSEKKASVQDVEIALSTLCDVVQYPLYVANATGNALIIRFVAELAAEIFDRAQGRFKDLVAKLDDGQPR